LSGSGRGRKREGDQAGELALGEMMSGQKIRPLGGIVDSKRTVEENALGKTGGAV